MIPFEHFVRDPRPYLRKCEELLGASCTGKTQRVLRKQKVPRSISTAGPDHRAYRRYSWRHPSGKSTEESELRERWTRVAAGVNAEAKQTLLKISQDYDQRYQIPFGKGGL